MKIYLVSFPNDTDALKRIREKGKKEVLLSYFFIHKTKPFKTILREIGVLKSKKKE